MSVSLEVQERATRPRSLRAELRHAGKVPAVVYGYNIESTPITIDEKELTKLLRENGANAVITMTVAGKKVNTLMYKAQLDTFTRAMKHVEFLSVNMKEETEVEAEVVAVGDPIGVKEGGVLAQNLYNVIVSATPDKLPERVEVDVTKMSIGDAITVADLPKDVDYEIVTDGEEQLFAVVERQEEVESDTEEPASPSVIGEKVDAD